MFCFALIAFEYFFAFAQAYITLSVGALSLGWLASIGTKSFGEQYLAAAWVSVMRLVLTICCISFVSTVVPTMESLSSTTDPNTVIIVLIKLCCTSLFGVLLAWKVPSFAASMFSGHPSVSGNEFVNIIKNTGGKAFNAMKGK
jgi:type IV secretory pathway TrbL component